MHSSTRRRSAEDRPTSAGSGSSGRSGRTGSEAEAAAMADAFGLVAVEETDAEQVQGRQGGAPTMTMGLGIGEGSLSLADFPGHGMAAPTVMPPNEASGYQYSRGLAARRSRMTPSPVVVTPPPAPSTSRTHMQTPPQPPSSAQSSTTPGSSGSRHRLATGFDLSDLRHSLLAGDPIASNSSPNPSATSSHPSPSASPRGFVPRPTRMTTTQALQNILAQPSPSQSHFPSPSFANPAPKPARPFSYKTHFKCAYLTEQAWLRGPGRLLSTQMSADRGIVTSLGYDNEWIVVGMSTSKVHVFEADTGTYVRTLDGHDQGVWCLTLVGRGGGPRADGSTAQGGDAGGDDADDAWNGGSSRNKGKGRARDEFHRPPASPMGTTFTQGLAPPSTHHTLRSAASSPSFLSPSFRDTSNTPLAASSYSSPSSPSRGSSAFPPRQPRRQRSAASLSPGPSSPAFSQQSSPPQNVYGPYTKGGMGIGAGGPTGDSLLQGNACGTARGWGQAGAVVVSGGCDRSVRVWDVSTGLCIHTLTGHTSTVRCLRVLDGRPIAVSGSRDGSVRVWDIDRGESVHVLAGHTMSVRAIDICGNKAVSGSYDATCRLWNVDTGECLHVFRGHLSQIYSVAFDGLRVITGSLDSTVRVWDAETGKFIALLQGHTSLVGQLHLDPHTGTLVSGGSDGRVIVYSLATYEPLHRINAHKSSVTCLQFDERFIVSGGNDGRIKLWDMRTGTYIRDLADQTSGIWRVIVRDDKCIVLSRREEPNPNPTAEEPELTVERTLMDVRTFRPSDAELYGKA
ncbi:hypothetical protein NBRC10512_001289 [Rhodotorula toruloides]|uniref:RHTO0S16e01068g1_1 n=2 Tax=Rhodotorula toruloides TaxID=5286 RepID=A0A061BJL6_RHOTO|nr:F-box and WD repeat domain containing protein [Rhodotorula toruloides NP11]EMS20926.1 F-box and WD repeat domain containing protein [Rhodotorula toruloides NP11]CDR48092.1 RHTO0S16e01068g1_1 [Rhodotorula toruloides]